MVKSILVATDFLADSETAAQQACWLARRTQARLTLAHVIPDIRNVLFSSSAAVTLDATLGAGVQYQDELKEEALARLHLMAKTLEQSDSPIHCRVLAGDPAVEISRLALREEHDLVLTGTRGDFAWEHYMIGSTAKRLFRKCPAPVWTAKSNAVIPPRTILMATDFSPASAKATRIACELASQSGAQLHVTHIVDMSNMPEHAVSKISHGWRLRDQFHAASIEMIGKSLTDLGQAAVEYVPHVTLGVPAREIARLSAQLNADLLVIGTVGRSGLQGALLGNTAECLLDLTRGGILAVKPDDFVCPADVREARQ